MCHREGFCKLQKLPLHISVCLFICRMVQKAQLLFWGRQVADSPTGGVLYLHTRHWYTYVCEACQYVGYVTSTEQYVSLPCQSPPNTLPSKFVFFSSWIWCEGPAGNKLNRRRAELHSVQFSLMSRPWKSGSPWLAFSLTSECVVGLRGMSRSH